MNYSTLIKEGLAFYWRTNLAVVLGVATAVAVLAGALVVGDSVRASLADLAMSRLGRTDFVAAGTGFFREGLAEDLRSDPEFGGRFVSSVPLIALQGVVTRDENNARAGGVQVFGVDDRFWRFHGSEIRTPEGGEALLSHALAAELGARAGEMVVLRIEKPSEIPIESLHGRKDQPGSTIRLTVAAALAERSLGDFSLMPRQGAVKSIFIPISKLQRNIEQEGKANILLVSGRGGGQSERDALATILRNKFQLADLGLKLRTLDGRSSFVLESDSAVIADNLAEAAVSIAGRGGDRPSPVLTYLANSIAVGGKNIPYSLVTALDRAALERIVGAPVKTGQEQEEAAIVLNSWAAEDLGAKVGDQVDLEYYLWRQEGGLETRQSQFRLSAVVPLEGEAADRDYAPQYPGITDTDSLSDWDPPFPLDLGRVRPKDEDYWRKYRTTPKAFILIEDGQKLWGTRYGRVTSIRFAVPEGSDSRAAMESFAASLRSAIDPAGMGLSIQAVRLESARASRGATDFGEYFTYFSFFIVVSALLLTTLFFRLGIEQRLREIGLLRSVGFSIAGVRKLYLGEGAVLAVAGSLAGLPLALGYAALMMFGLRTWWVGAVGTTLLSLHVAAWPLAAGFAAGVITALGCIWWTLRGLASASPRGLLAGSSGAAGQARSRSGPGLLSLKGAVVVFCIAGLALLLAATFRLVGQAGGFFGAGTLFLLAVLCFWAYWLRGDRKMAIHGAGWLPLWRLGFRNASYRPGRSVLCIALIASAAFIIVSVDAFRRSDSGNPFDPKSGNGGYKLAAESLLPIVHNFNSEEGRGELNLAGVDLTDVTVTRFRLRPGDDASCLNLFQPRNPRILGASRDFIAAGRFAFQSSAASNEPEKQNPWRLLDRDLSAGAGSARVVPVIADANSLAYVLHLGIGDEMEISAADGLPLRLRVVASLADSILQGELIMSEENFVKYFPGVEGYRFFLVDAPAGATQRVSNLLEERLSDFGFDAIGTEEKLAGFHQVENTYISTFQALGGLGLLLGTLGLSAVLLRNVFERRRELALLRAVGYQPRHLSLLVVAENLLLLGCGLLTGLVCALLAIAPVFLARSGRISAASLALIFAAVFVVGLASSLAAVLAAVSSPLIPALGSE